MHAWAGKTHIHMDTTLLCICDVKLRFFILLPMSAHVLLIWPTQISCGKWDICLGSDPTHSIFIYYYFIVVNLFNVISCLQHIDELLIFIFGLLQIFIQS